MQLLGPVDQTLEVVGCKPTKWVKAELPQGSC